MYCRKNETKIKFICAKYSYICEKRENNPKRIAFITQSDGLPISSCILEFKTVSYVYYLKAKFQKNISYNLHPIAHTLHVLLPHLEIQYSKGLLYVHFFKIFKPNQTLY